MTKPVRDAGFVGRLVSLAGVLGAEGLGRSARHDSVSISSGLGVIGLESNPLRIAASVQNYSVDDVLNVFLGDTTDGPVFTLKHLGYLQIDINMPWTGAIYLQSGGTGIAAINEMSIQQ